MTLFNRKVDYALLILSHLYQNTPRGCAREIAGRFGLSRAFVANILKDLCHKGFVASHRGVKGGYVVARPAVEVTVADLIEAMDDTFRVTECTDPNPAQENCSLVHVCPIKGPIAELHHRLRQVLETITLAELLRSTPAAMGPAGLLGLPMLANVSLTGAADGGENDFCPGPAE